MTVAKSSRSLLPQSLPDGPALLDDTSDRWISYSVLFDLAKGWQHRLDCSAKALVFLYVDNDVESVSALLGAQLAGHAVVLLDPGLPIESRAKLEHIYQPDWIISPSKGQAVFTAAKQSASEEIHPDLAFLLSTSGSTGSPKFVRLSLNAVCDNAAAIAQVLGITNEDVAAGYLPLHYSYGLSVLTSHLSQGARIRLTKRGITEREFWPAMRGADVTHMPGVPFHFQMFQKLGFKRLNLATLKTLTQAGGVLSLEGRLAAHEFMESVGGRFYVMYGQTEASPRMTTLQHDDFLTAPHSVGSALPGCRIEIANPGSSGEGEIIFVGPNVMMGYAETREDLAHGDDLGGRLVTGDVGRLEAGGMLTLVGRTKRFGKIVGLRVNFDELEALVARDQEAAVMQIDDSIVIFMVGSAEKEKEQVQREVVLAKLDQYFTLPRSVYRFRVVESIPRTERGKVDYHALERLA